MANDERGEGSKKQILDVNAPFYQIYILRAEDGVDSENISCNSSKQIYCPIIIKLSCLYFYLLSN